MQGMILFAHGARDARWAEPFQRLQQQVQSASPEVAVHLAFLEFMQPSLPELIPQMLADGIEHISLIPVFLAQGGHVLRDLPKMLDELRAQYPQLNVSVAKAIGEDEGVMRAIASYCVATMSGAAA
jgi:sirohydrochlorin cobaltochelatase